MKVSKKRLMKLANVSEEVQQIKHIDVTKQLWDRLPFDTRANVLLTAVKDPDDAEKYSDMDWDYIPDEVTANMVIFVKR